MGVLLMLMTIGGVIVAATLFTVAWLNESAWLKKFVLGGVAIWFLFYAVMLIGASLTSEEKVLGLNEPKQFCGFYLDCHLHAAVSGVRTAKTIRDREANGDFYVVTVKVFSDAKRATLGLLTVDAHVVDPAGRAYTRDEMAEALLEPQPEFETKIGPEKSLEKQIVFDLPADVKQPRLDIREGYGIDHAIELFLIGDEDSILHARTFIALHDRDQ